MESKDCEEPSTFKSLVNEIIQALF